MRKFKSKSKRKKQRALLSQALVLYDDEIADFSEDVAFHCDAFACLAKHHEDLSDASVEGLEHKCTLVKDAICGACRKAKPNKGVGFR